MRARIARIECDRAAKFTLRLLPLPVVNEQGPREGRVGSRYRLVECQRLPRVFLGALVRLLDRYRSVIDVERVRIGEPGVRGGVTRILRNRLLEVTDRLGDAFLSPLVPFVSPFQVQAIRLNVFGVAPRV